MDEIRSVNDLEKKRFSIRIYSDRLLNLFTDCSIDGAWSQATGDMYYKEAISSWLVEYSCPMDGELFRKWTPDIDALTKQIARDVLEEENKDG